MYLGRFVRRLIAEAPVMKDRKAVLLEANPCAAAEAIENDLRDGCGSVS